MITPVETSSEVPVAYSLPSFTETKLKLASIAETLLTLARERKDDERVRTIQRLLADLAEDAFRLAVVGKYNRGKSSLMNAMLGHDWLPPGILPLTSVITTVRYGSDQRVVIRREGSCLTREISLEDLPQYVTEEQNPGNKKQVELAEIQLPADLLRYGFLFIDTPGLGSGIAANTAATERFLPEVDAAIVVLSFESPLDEADMKLLGGLHRLGRKLFIVLNKADLVSPDEQNRVASFVCERLSNQLHETPLLFPLSARDGLSARRNGDSAALERSGLKTFEDQLIHFLTTQKAELFLHRMIERNRALLEQEDLECFLSGQLRSGEAKATQLAAIQEQGKIVLAKVNDTFLRFHQRLPGLFVVLLDDDLSLWCAGRKREALSAKQENRAIPSGSFTDWIRPRVASATGKLLESGKENLRQLEEAFQHLQNLGNQLLGRETPNLQVDEYELLYGIQRRNVEIPKLPAFQWSSPEWTQAIPSAWLRKRAAARLEKEFLLAADSYLETIRPILEQACRHWLERAQRLAEQTVQGYVGRLAAIANRPDTMETAPILRDLKAQLSKIAGGLQDSYTGLPDPDGSLVSEMGEANYTTFCSVCRKASDAAFHFITRFQFQLTKDPALREEVSRNGGPCPFHTWMYESVGSPQGIAQGYAYVLEKLATGLEEVAREETMNEMSRELNALLPSSQECRICQVTRRAESLALDEISQTELSKSGKEDSSPCTYGFRKVLTSKPFRRVCELEVAKTIDQLVASNRRANCACCTEHGRVRAFKLRGRDGRSQNHQSPD
ncbi:MAG TPA: dynamin family protein [Bryobacteraceae bacterium]|jgi:GTP-binding protein EngB required for normal cell division|nr:dynamin family protein [Bryobacteraceae bacterium]